MNLALALADIALRASRAPAEDYLRALTATNLAAGVGELGASAALIDALPLDRSSPAGAAMLYGMLLHARTQDDFHPLGRVHVGAVALAATLALAEQARDRTLQCLAAGYEVMCAVAVVYAAEAQRRGFRPSGLFGPLAAAAAAGVALGFGREALANAIALAAARSAGTNQSWISGTDEWLLEVGHAARSGVEAALFAQSGVRAAGDALEGRAGWTRAYFGDESGARLAAALGEHRTRTAEVAVKPYPVSGIAQVATHLACEARARVGSALPDRITVRMAAAEATYPGTQNAGPFKSRSDALMSIAFCVACGLSDGVVSMRRLESPNQLQPLISRVTVLADPQLPERTTILQTSTADGQHELRADAVNLLHPRWPWNGSATQALAARSEAPSAVVSHVCAALASSSPDARRLSVFLEERA